MKTRSERHDPFRDKSAQEIWETVLQGPKNDISQWTITSVDEKAAKRLTYLLHMYRSALSAQYILEDEMLDAFRVTEMYRYTVSRKNNIIKIELSKEDNYTMEGTQ